jgi:hypothetical protein
LNEKWKKNARQCISNAGREIYDITSTNSRNGWTYRKHHDPSPYEPRPNGSVSTTERGRGERDGAQFKERCRATEEQSDKWEATEGDVPKSTRNKTKSKAGVPNRKRTRYAQSYGFGVIMEVRESDEHKLEEENELESPRATRLTDEVGDWDIITGPELHPLQRQQKHEHNTPSWKLGNGSEKRIISSVSNPPSGQARFLFSRLNATISYPILNAKIIVLLASFSLLDATILIPNPTPTSLFLHITANRVLLVVRVNAINIIISSNSHPRVPRESGFRLTH